MGTENLKVVTYEGILGIEQADGIKSQLTALIGQGATIVVNLSRVEWIDLSVIQIVISAKKSAMANRLDLTFTNLVSDPVLKAFHTAGISPNNQLTGQDLSVVLADFILGTR